MWKRPLRYSAASISVTCVYVLSNMSRIVVVAVVFAQYTSIYKYTQMSFTIADFNHILAHSTGWCRFVCICVSGDMSHQGHTTQRNTQPI